jgi:hypothetical protein
MDNPNLRLAVELRDKLLDELRQSQTFRAYQHIEAAISALTAETESSQEPLAPEKTGDRRAFKPGTQSGAIVAGAVAYLRRKSARAPSGEIAKMLVAQGIVVSGKDPGSTVSSYLSHSALFDNVKGEGYGLVEWFRSKTETPNSDTLFGAPKGNGSSPLSP